MTTERYWLDHCISIARDSGNVDAAQDATKELEELRSALTASEKRLAYCEANTIALDFRYGDKGQEDTVMVVRLPADGRYTTSFAKNIDAAMEKADG